MGDIPFNTIRIIAPTYAEIILREKVTTEKKIAPTNKVLGITKTITG